MSNFVPSQHPRDKAGQFVTKPAVAPTAAKAIPKVKVEKVLIPGNETSIEVDYLDAIYLEECYEGGLLPVGPFYIVCSKDTDSFFTNLEEAVEAAYRVEETFGHLGEGYHPEVYTRIIGPWSSNWDIGESADLEYVYWVECDGESKKFDNRDAAANYAIDYEESNDSYQDFVPAVIRRRAMTKWVEHVVGG